MLSDLGSKMSAERLRKLRTLASLLSDHPEQSGCGRKFQQGRTGSSREILYATTSCKRKWVCPVCAYRASKVEAKKMKLRLLQWSAKGGQVAFLTLTLAHGHLDPLDVLLGRLEAGWRAVMTSRAWRRDGASYGIRGFMRVTEIVHSATNGWHPHYHVILLLDRAPDSCELNCTRIALATRFIGGVTHKGGRAELPCQDLRLVSVQDCNALAKYCFNGLTVNQSSDGSRTPMAILNDFEKTGEGLDLWSEFSAAAHRGRRQFSVSHGIDNICAEGPHNP